MTNSKKFWKHLFLVVLIKSILLTGMWYVFFKDAPALNNKTAGTHIFFN